jgi:pilus assembly protein Flp/PilA
MTKALQFVVDFCKRDDGPTAVEYAVMLALILLVCFAAIVAFGSSTNKSFTSSGEATNLTNP